MKASWKRIVFFEVLAIGIGFLGLVIMFVKIGLYDMTLSIKYFLFYFFSFHIIVLLEKLARHWGIQRLVKSRDKTLFPEDRSGDGVWRMHHSGVDFSKSRVIDFWAIFQNEDAARQFALTFLQDGEKVSFSRSENKEFPWQTGIHKVIKPGYLEISEFEKEIESRAKVFEGKLDGWGYE